MLHINQHHTNKYLYQKLKDITNACSLRHLGYTVGSADVFAIYNSSVVESYRYSALVTKLAEAKEKELREKGWV